jgi:hypothetical protein
VTILGTHSDLANNDFFPSAFQLRNTYSGRDCSAPMATLVDLLYQDAFKRYINKILRAQTTSVDTYECAIAPSHEVCVTSRQSIVHSPRRRAITAPLRFERLSRNKGVRLFDTKHAIAFPLDVDVHRKQLGDPRFIDNSEHSVTFVGGQCTKPTPHRDTSRLFFLCDGIRGRYCRFRRCCV